VTDPSISVARVIADRQRPTSGTVLLDDDDVISSVEAPSDPFTSEDPTAPPEEFLPSGEYKLIHPSDMSEPSVERIPIAKNPWTEGLEVEGTVTRTSDLGLPPETPSSPEEATSPMPRLVSDELRQLRAEIIDATDKAVEDSIATLSRGPSQSSPPVEFDVESLHTTLRHRLVADLFVEVEKAKKRGQ
jgi:hypothetical protein